jgi:hypothetical protein
VTAVGPGWLAGKTILTAAIDHDSCDDVVRIRLELTDGTRLNLAAEQDAVIGWEVIYPTPVWIGTIDMPERRPPAFVLVCRDCGDAEIPFPSAAERGRWASAHTEGTGHTSFRVFEFLPGGAW